MVKNKKYFLVVMMVLCMCARVANAQQQMQLTQYTFNTLSYNPGYAGHRYGINLTGTFRNQWTGFGKTVTEDDPNSSTTGGNGSGLLPNGQGTSTNSSTKTTAAPMMYMVSADMPIRVLKGGIGLNICGENIGLNKNIFVDLGYAYQHDFAGGGKLGIGAQVRFANLVLSIQDFIPGTEGDWLLQQMEENDFLVDCNFGVYYSKPNSFFWGISALNLIETQGRSTMIKGVRSYNAYGGYDLRFPANPKIKLTPSILVKTDLATFQIDASAILSIQDRYWFGANYRINEGLGIILGLSFLDFQLGYSYDIPMSSLTIGGSWGSHEVVLRYSFKLEREKGKITQKNTRYL